VNEIFTHTLPLCYNYGATKSDKHREALMCPQSGNRCLLFVAENNVPTRAGAPAYGWGAEGKIAMECGKWCVYFKVKGKTSACTRCEFYNNEKPPAGFGKGVDIFELAKGLKEREQRKESKIVLEICPYCGEKSWWLNPHTQRYECMNTETCPTNNPQE
jgi:hypothetical protein